MKRLSILVISLLAILMGGCGGSQGPQSAQSVQGSATFKVVWPAARVIPTGATSISLTMTSSTGAVIASGLIAKPSTTWSSGQLNPGSYTITANAYPNANGSGTAQATGTASVQIVANQVTPTSLTMGSTVSSVQVSLLAASVPMGLTDPATATCRDAQNNVVLVGPGTVTWGVSDATKATVSTSGVITGVAVGTPTVTATFNEVEPALNQTPVSSTPQTVSVTTDYAYAPAGYKIVWSDEFNGNLGSTPNPANWTYDFGGGGWGNNEQETYTGTNATVVADSNAIDGKALDIQAQSSNGTITSSRIKTQGLQQFTYGYIVCRAKVPPGGTSYQGYWPAFWMLGSSFSTVGWPTCGEQDIMEHLCGTQPLLSYQSLHGNYSGGTSEWTTTYSLTGAEDMGSAYHTYAVLWSQNSIQFFVDGVADGPVQTPSNIGGGTAWEFNQPDFIILNMAVGGNWPGATTAGTSFPANFLIDYVRVYQAGS